MLFEWDESKRRRNVEWHGLDFLDAQPLFDGRPVYTYTSPRHGEERFVTIGLLEGRFLAAVWTWREGRVRLISVRRARDAEKRRYRNLHG
jgi:uncharacterized protein